MFALFSSIVARLHSVYAIRRVRCAHHRSIWFLGVGITCPPTFSFTETSGKFLVLVPTLDPFSVTFPKTCSCFQFSLQFYLSSYLCIAFNQPLFHCRFQTS